MNDDPIPLYAQLDIWQALGHDPADWREWRFSMSFAEAWAQLCVEARTVARSNTLTRKPSSALVVDREALELFLFASEYPTPKGSVRVSAHLAWTKAESARLIASGLFVDRAVVEAEQREKDAQIAEGNAPEMGPHINVSEYRQGKADGASIIAAAIRAGGAA